MGNYFGFTSAQCHEIMIFDENCITYEEDVDNDRLFVRGIFALAREIYAEDGYITLGLFKTMLGIDPISQDYDYRIVANRYANDMNVSLRIWYEPVAVHGKFAILIHALVEKY